MNRASAPQQINLMASLSDRPLLGPVTLTVPDLARSVAWYQEALGLQIRGLANAPAGVHLGADGGGDLLILEEGGTGRPSIRTAGLFHMAFLLPSREALARQLRHFALARIPLQGASDHRVSEALYLSDPDGNGIEIYRDRPREEWIWRNGEVDMVTEPMDVDGVLATLAGRQEEWDGMPAGTVLGHVHLRVSGLAAAGAFYRDLLGFDVTTRSYPGALFLSKHGYHHHIGLNIWQSAGAPPPPEGSPGLRQFEIRAETLQEWNDVRTRAEGAGMEVHEQGDGSLLLLRDPSGNGVAVRRPEQEEKKTGAAA